MSFLEYMGFVLVIFPMKYGFIIVQNHNMHNCKKFEWKVSKSVKFCSCLTHKLSSALRGKRHIPILYPHIGNKHMHFSKLLDLVLLISG